MRIVSLAVFTAYVSGCSGASSQWDPAVAAIDVEAPDSGSDADVQAAPDSAPAVVEPDAGEVADSSVDAADARYGEYGYGAYCSTVLPCQSVVSTGQCKAGLTTIVCDATGAQDTVPPYAGCNSVGFLECDFGKVQTLCCAN